MLRVCFVGVGSIALRHIKNLRDMYGGDITILAFRSGNGRLLESDERDLIDDVIDDHNLLPVCDAYFITNPTSEHFSAVEAVLDKSNTFFIEKPVFMTGNENYNAFLGSGKVFYVACPCRYSKVVEFIKKNIDLSSVYSIRTICSSYLPDWRSGVDYRKTYSAQKSLGGGVSIDLIHEWDYLVYLFGYPKMVKCMISHKSNLEIDSDDIAVYIAEYPGFLLELHLDYFGRRPSRIIELYTRDDVIECDLYSSRISYLRENIIIDLKDLRDDYQKRELEHFMKILERKEKTDNDLDMACRTLRLTRGLL